MGKTSLRSQFIHHQFSGSYRATVSAGDFLSTKVPSSTGDELVTLLVWDTAGQERFNSLGTTFYRGTDVLVLVYDITNAQSFAGAARWLRQFWEVVADTPSAPGQQPASVVLVGNKTDREDYRAVSTRQALEFAAAQWGTQVVASGAGKSAAEQVEAMCFEVSAKEATDVKRLFTAVADIVVQRARASSGGSREMQAFEVDGGSGGIDIAGGGHHDSGFLGKCC